MGAVSPLASKATMPPVSGRPWQVVAHAPGNRRPHVMHVFPSFIPGGSELRTAQLIDAFGDRFRHSIVSLDGRTTAASYLPSGSDVRILPALTKHGTVRTTAALCRLIRHERPDLALTYNWGAFDMLLAADLLGVRVVHQEDGFNADEAERLKQRRVLARRLVLRRVHRVIVPSRLLRSIAVERWRVAPERVVCIPNGVTAPPPVGDPAALRRSIGIPLGAYVIGNVGSLRREKSLPRLVDMLAAIMPLVDSHLLLVGEGPERDQIAARAAALGLSARVHLVGHQNDVCPFLAAMDLFAMSSDTEQMPVSLLQAMAAGLPVTATRVGDIEIMLPECQREFLTASDSATARSLADHARRLLLDPAMSRSLGARNRRRVLEHYGLAQMADAYLAEYLDALKERSS